LTVRQIVATAEAAARDGLVGGAVTAPAAGSWELRQAPSSRHCSSGRPQAFRRGPCGSGGGQLDTRLPGAPVVRCDHGVEAVALVEAHKGTIDLLPTVISPIPSSP
jgi:hypothetical protein